MFTDPETVRRRSLAVFLLFSLIPAVAAVAQEPAQQAEERPEEEVAEEVAEEFDDEITVTAQKIERSLQETKESVAVLEEAVIVERGLIDLEDALQQTAGVSGGGRSFRIRGIDSGPIGTLRSELASLYVDGVALSGWVKAEGPQQLWDVQQVEILRGPQSTNLGRNSLAGAIVIKTHDPDYSNTARVRLAAGSLDTTEISGIGNLSLADGKSAVRLALRDFQNDGATDNVTRGEDDYAYETRLNLRLKWLYQATDDVRLQLSAEHVENDYGDTTVAFEGSGFDRADRVALADVRGEYPIEADLYSLTADVNLGDGWSLRSVTAGMDGDRSRTDDFDNTAANGGVVTRNGQDDNWSQELRFNYDGDRLRSSFGAYYTEVDADNVNDTSATLDLEGQINALLPGLGTLFVNFGVYPAEANLLLSGSSTFRITNQAVFGELEYRASDSWSLSLGARYDREEQEIGGSGSSSSDVVLPNPADWAFLGPAAQGAIVLVNQALAVFNSQDPPVAADTDFDAVLPHVGVTYAASDSTSVSLFAKRGYRSGGTEVTGLGFLNEYDPEYLTNYELALRSRLAGGRGTFNANIYYGSWEDQQIDVPELPGSSAFFRIENAGESELMGVEADFRYSFSPSVSAFAVLGLSETEYVDFQANGEDFSGNEFRFAPDVTGAAGINYTFPSDTFVNVTVTYQSSSFANNSNTIELESRTLLNARVSHSWGGVTLEAYGSNLTDKDYATNIFGLQPVPGQFQFGRMGDPLEVGARLTYGF